VRTYDFWRVDVFADHPLEGNPLAVFPRAQGLTDAEMLKIAREMNLSETTFILPSSAPGADYRNRIFTPGGEIPFAGHPSLGTAYVAAMEGIVPMHDGVVRASQEVGIGVLPLELTVSGGMVERVVMVQGAPKLGGHLKNMDMLARALGVTPKDITATGLLPQVVSTGAPSLQIPLASADLLRNLRPDMNALRNFLGRIGPDAGAYVFAWQGNGSDIHARGFFPQHGIAEDPATGSAAGACGAFLAGNGRFPLKDWLVIAQGAEVHHPSRIEVSVATDGGRPAEVRVAGRVLPVMRGTLTLP